MPSDNQIAVFDDQSLTASGLSDDLIARCRALNLTRSHIFAVDPLNKLYGIPSEEIVGYVENGIALPRVAECLRLRHELQELNDTDVETVNEYVDLIDFRLPNEIDDFATNGRMIYNGRAMTQEQREDELIQQLISDEDNSQSVTNTPIIQHAHDKIIETLLEGSEDAFSKSDDPVKDLLEKIKADMDGDILRAYHLCVGQPNDFRRFLKGKIDIHSLRYETYNADEDVPIHEEI